MKSISKNIEKIYEIMYYLHDRTKEMNELMLTIPIEDITSNTIGFAVCVLPNNLNGL